MFLIMNAIAHFEFILQVYFLFTQSKLIAKETI